jgi:methyl-accepting chemotaxis protein
MNFNNWKIKNKIILSIVLSCVMFLAMGITAIIATGKVYSNGNYIFINTVPSIDVAHSIDTDAAQYVSLQYQHIISNDNNEMANLEKQMTDKNTQIQQLIERYSDNLVSDDTDKGLIANVKAQWDDYMKVSDQVTTFSRSLKTDAAMQLMKGQGTPDYNTCSQTLNDLVTFNQNLANDNGQSLTSVYNITKIGSIIFLCVGIVALILINILILLSITKPLTSNSEKLGEAAKMIAGASSQLAASSQQLAEASSEQAASIEEVSATMDESSSMVIQSTENTRQASTLANQANEASDVASKEMKDMMLSMNEIKNSSSEISKIIKVIDEIAFQTNILALNAAVEAARAGDAGKGFAVVAEEVRTLAQRSADAAKDTSAIIEKNIQLSTRGGEASIRVNNSLNDISTRVNKLNDLISEITAASQEEAQGIEQVNKAISQMESVTQQNASVAEESASAAEELTVQADTLENVVRNLTLMVKGLNEFSEDQFSTSMKRNTVNRNKQTAFNTTKHTLVKNRINSTKSAVRPEDIIPLDDDNDF